MAVGGLRSFWQFGVLPFKVFRAFWLRADCAAQARAAGTVLCLWLTLTVQWLDPGDAARYWFANGLEALQHLGQLQGFQWG
jgi:hypothetical protein